MATFLSEENTKLMWDIIIEQDSYINLIPEEKLKIDQIFKSTRITYYHDQLNKGITSLQELDKQYIRFIIDKIHDYTISLDIREYPIKQEEIRIPKQEETDKLSKQEDMDKLLNEMVLERNYHTKPIPPKVTILNTENSFQPITEEVPENNSFLKKLKKIDKPMNNNMDSKIEKLEKEVAELKRILYEIKERVL